MANSDKILRKVLSGAADKNIPFKGLCQLLTKLGFVERVRGDHHIFTHVQEILNLQPLGAKAKAYR